ncbi:MAG TPA: selenoneine synthase SenA [Burkholderiaceae bacterium]|jgi:ergothioneine biosynthesis protein EgtB
MSSSTFSFRNATPGELAEAMQDARDYTLTVFECFAAAGLDQPEKVARLPYLNPPAWELGHIAWFAEWYVLREALSSNPADAVRTAMLTKGDDWFDPNTVPHRSRWGLGLPGSGALKMYCREVLDRVLDKLGREDDDDEALYPYRLSLAYEDLRSEALATSLQALGVILPPELAQRTMPNWSQGEIRFPGGTIALGSPKGEGFVFDNEKWAHSCYVPTFTMDSTLVSNAQFAEFIADGGYEKPSFWSVAGRAWLMAQECSAPRDWIRHGTEWLCERFALRVALNGAEPVRHVNLYEAQAYCLWAGRRLPSEAEWEFAVMSGHPALRWGDLWEWTCTPFEPYPGFEADAYREYSVPAFATHQTLRGASFATQPRMRWPKFRAFAFPDRSQMFVGFRTCAA